MGCSGNRRISTLPTKILVTTAGMGVIYIYETQKWAILDKIIPGAALQHIRAWDYEISLSSNNQPAQEVSAIYSIYSISEISQYGTLLHLGDLEEEACD